MVLRLKRRPSVTVLINVGRGDVFGDGGEVGPSGPIVYSHHHMYAALTRQVSSRCTVSEKKKNTYFTHSVYGPRVESGYVRAVCVCELTALGSSTPNTPNTPNT